MIPVDDAETSGKKETPCSNNSGVDFGRLMILARGVLGALLWEGHQWLAF